MVVEKILHLELDIISHTTIRNHFFETCGIQFIHRILNRLFLQEGVVYYWESPPVESIAKCDRRET